LALTNCKMLDTLIQSKTRIKLLLRFFLNPDSSAYLRGLAQEFEESTNSVRIELNRFEEAGLITAHKEGNKKMYGVNTDHPLFNDFHQIALKHFGIDRIIEQVIEKLGDLDAVYLTGDLARGLDTNIVDIVLIGDDIDAAYLASLTEKAEKIVDKKIRTVIFRNSEDINIQKPRLLIFGEEIKNNTRIN
jgi:predicted nucleotidyltransferase